MVGRPTDNGRRRTSFARRDNNIAILGALFTGVMLTLAVLLLLLQRINPELGNRLRGAMLDGLSPMLSVARAPVDAARRIGNVVRDNWRVADENRALKAALAASRADIARSQQLMLENARLRELLKLRRPERRLVVSTVAAASPVSATSRSAIIAAGLAQGVRPRMPVIAAEGLAGRVTDVGMQASRILLLSDPSSRVPVKVVRTGWTGLAVGNGGTALEFTFDIASGIDRIRIGDELVTSGDGGLFPPGVPVAVIVDDKASTPLARPLANPAALGPVTVEAPWLPPPKFVAAEPANPEADIVPAPAAQAPAVATPATAATATGVRPKPANAPTAPPRRTTP